MVICLEQGEDLHMAQLMPLPLTVSCFSKIQIGFTFLVPAHPGSPGKGAVKRVYIYVQAIIQSITRLLTKKKLTHRSIAWISRREKPSPRPADFLALLSDGQHTSLE